MNPGGARRGGNRRERRRRCRGILCRTKWAGLFRGGGGRLRVCLGERGPRLHRRRRRGGRGRSFGEPGEFTEVAAGFLGAVEVVLAVPSEDEAAAGSAGADVEEAVLFGEAAFFLREPGGEFVVGGGGEDDGGEFEAFGLVDGEEEDAVFLLEIAVSVVAEGGDFEDGFGGEVGGEGGVVVAFEHGAEVDEILDALFAGILFAIPLYEAGGGENFA